MVYSRPRIELQKSGRFSYRLSSTDLAVCSCDVTVHSSVVNGSGEKALVNKPTVVSYGRHNRSDENNRNDYDGNRTRGVYFVTNPTPTVTGNIIEM